MRLDKILYLYGIFSYTGSLKASSEDMARKTITQTLNPGDNTVTHPLGVKVRKVSVIQPSDLKAISVNWNRVSGAETTEININVSDTINDAEINVIGWA